jgi:hypothetical protein
LLPLMLWVGAFSWLSRYDLDEEKFNEIKARLGRQE